MLRRKPPAITTASTTTLDGPVRAMSNSGPVPGCITPSFVFHGPLEVHVTGTVAERTSRHECRRGGRRTNRFSDSPYRLAVPRRSDRQLDDPQRGRAQNCVAIRLVRSAISQSGQPSRGSYIFTSMTWIHDGCGLQRSASSHNRFDRASRRVHLIPPPVRRTIGCC